MYIKKAHLNVKRGVEDVVGVPLGGDSDPPAMRAQHPFHFQISCHLKVESVKYATFAVSWFG